LPSLKRLDIFPVEKRSKKARIYIQAAEFKGCSMNLLKKDYCSTTLCMMKEEILFHREMNAKEFLRKRKKIPVAGKVDRC
jgi:hypothetical protein